MIEMSTLAESNANNETNAIRGARGRGDRGEDRDSDFERELKKADMAACLMAFFMAAAQLDFSDRGNDSHSAVIAYKSALASAYTESLNRDGSTAISYPDKTISSYDLSDDVPSPFVLGGSGIDRKIKPQALNQLLLDKAFEIQKHQKISEVIEFMAKDKNQQHTTVPLQILMSHATEQAANHLYEDGYLSNHSMADIFGSKAELILEDAENQLIEQMSAAGKDSNALPPDLAIDSADNHAKLKGHADHDKNNCSKDWNMGEMPMGMFNSGSMEDISANVTEAKTFTGSKTFNHILIEQISGKMGIAFKHGIGKASISLDPPSLGHLKVDIVVKDNMVRASIAAEHPIVKEVLEANLHGLKHALVQQGMILDGLTVFIGHRSGSNGEGLNSYYKTEDNADNISIKNIEHQSENLPLMRKKEERGIDIFI